MTAENSWADSRKSAEYAKLAFPNTYYLAYRDLPHLIATYAKPGRALDFGCGAGRSSRFLRGLGFDVTGVDIAANMIRQARDLDPDGDYQLITEGTIGPYSTPQFDLVAAIFTFDNIPQERKGPILQAMRAVLRAHGNIVLLVSAPDMYTHEWASFSTRAFPENAAARSGDAVRIVVTDIDDARPVVDIVCSDAHYRSLFDQSGLAVRAVHQPLGRADEPVAWVSETAIAPWTVYILQAQH
jgi:SAM-dependent methyltransferase